ncbi:MAG: S1C family serine protease, partial [Candidatus Zixiibacteriota bacterium]
MKNQLVSAAGRAITSLLPAAFFAATVPAADTSLYRLEHGLNELIYQISRSVVTVEGLAPVASTQSQTDETIQSLVSTGIVYDLHGHILVSAEAVADRERIQVRFEDQVYSAALRGIDHQTGLAVIHTNRKVGVPATLGSARGCAGQMVIAMGNAYGVRACPSLGFCAGTRPDGTIQFSAPITAGTVGGGLFDLSGSLVGLVVGGIGPSNRPEVGLAIPAHAIPDIVRHLLIEGDRPVGYIGVTTADIEISPPVKLSPVNRMAASAAP